MADYPVYTAQDLANFSGRPVSSYSSYADVACDQATLLFKMATCLAALPDDSTSFQLAENAILALADYLVLVQPFQEEAVGPYQSENIGSYSYSRRFRMSGGSAAQAQTLFVNIAGGDALTGVAWFDLAVQKLGVCDISEGVSYGGGVEVFEHDGVHTNDNWSHSENDRILGPRELDRETVLWGEEPDPGAHLNRPGVPEYPTPD